MTIDTTPPTVTVNQATGQVDPGRIGLAINFSAVFSEPVFNFAAAGVTLGGTAGASSVVVTNPSGDHMTYNLAVSGTTQAGTVIVSLAAAVAIDTAGNANTASTSTDNTVTVVSRTRTWDGSGTDNNWTTAANWSDSVAPIAGDTLVFAGSTRPSPNDDLPGGTVLDSITFANGGFTLTGGNVKLTPAGGVGHHQRRRAERGQVSHRIKFHRHCGGAGRRVDARAERPEHRPQRRRCRHPDRQVDFRLHRRLDAGGGNPCSVDRQLSRRRWDIGSFRSSKAVANGTTLGWEDYSASSQVTVMATIPGDFNLDGTVDSADLAILYANVWNGRTWSQGDANYDGTVNGLDRDIWAANFSRSVNGP